MIQNDALFARRRHVLRALSAGVAVSFSGALAQQPVRNAARIGVLVAESAPHPFTDAFRLGMQQLGYVEGRNVIIEWRYADALYPRAVELATELVRTRVTLIVAHHTPAVKAAMSATTTIPIVMAPAGAPMQAGLVRSLSRPGGNVTGLSSMEAELGGKRLAILRTIIPALARVAVLGAKTDPFTKPFVDDFEAAAARTGIELRPLMAGGAAKDGEQTRLHGRVAARCPHLGPNQMRNHTGGAITPTSRHSFHACTLPKLQGTRFCRGQVV